MRHFMLHLQTSRYKIILFTTQQILVKVNFMSHELYSIMKFATHRDDVINRLVKTNMHSQIYYNNFIPFNRSHYLPVREHEYCDFKLSEYYITS